MTDFRIEKDSMGEVRVPARAYYGAQSQRAVENFPVSGLGMPMPVVHAVALVKGLAAEVNAGLGFSRLTGGSDLPRRREVLEGAFDDQFVVDVFQTGSGTSTNMKRERGAGETGRTKLLGKPLGGTPGPSERPREPVPVEQRRDPDGDPDRRPSGNCPNGSSRRSPRCGTRSPERRRSSPTS